MPKMSIKFVLKGLINRVVFTIRIIIHLHMALGLASAMYRFNIGTANITTKVYHEHWKTTRKNQPIVNDLRMNCPLLNTAHPHNTWQY